MLLVFGSIRIETKGLPDAGVHVYRPVSKGGPVRVHIAVTSGSRAAVGKWAKRLGAPVTERLIPPYENDPLPLPLEIAAQREADGYVVRVYTRTAAPAEQHQRNGGA